MRNAWRLVERFKPEVFGGVPTVLAAALNVPVGDADEFERRYILASLKNHRGNVTRTAEALDVERSNLYRKLKSYGIEVARLAIEGAQLHQGAATSAEPSDRSTAELQPPPVRIPPPRTRPA